MIGLHPFEFEVRHGEKLEECPPGGFVGALGVRVPDPSFENIQECFSRFCPLRLPGRAWNYVAGRENDFRNCIFCNLCIGHKKDLLTQKIENARQIRGAERLELRTECKSHRSIAPLEFE